MSEHLVVVRGGDLERRDDPLPNRQRGYNRE